MKSSNLEIRVLEDNLGKIIVGKNVNP